MCRCAKYYEQGARFAKWRAVLKIGNGCPSGEPDAVLRLRALLRGSNSDAAVAS